MTFLDNHLGGGDTRKTRSDGAQSREPLLVAAMHLITDRGFTPTSIRDIVSETVVNAEQARMTAPAPPTPRATLTTLTTFTPLTPPLP